MLEKWGIMHWLGFRENIYSITQVRVPIMEELYCGRKEALIHCLEQKHGNKTNPTCQPRKILYGTRTRMICPP